MYGDREYEYRQEAVDLMLAWPACDALVSDRSRNIPLCNGTEYSTVLTDKTAEKIQTRCSGHSVIHSPLIVIL
jgi:hypothetical protein